MDFLVFILAMGIIITLHELGHLIAAKSFGVYCREFSIGFGPKLTSFKGKETEYSLRGIPLGGYVAIAGEPDEDDLMPADLPAERTLPGIKPWKRIIIYMAGIIMNVFLFILAFTIFFSVIGAPDTDNISTSIYDVQKNSPAEIGGLKPGDTITKIIKDNQTYPINNYQDLQKVTHDNSESLIYVVTRDQQEIEVELTPRLDEASGRYLVGISFETPRKSLGIFSAFIEATGFAWTYTVLIFKTLGNLFMGRGLDQVGGIVAIYQETSKVVDLGIVAIIAWIGQLSLNIGIFNALPIPALDGGRVLLTLAEMILGRPLSKKLESRLIAASFILLLGLIVIIMINDVVKLF